MKQGNERLIKRLNAVSLTVKGNPSASSDADWIDTGSKIFKVILPGMA